MDVTEQLLDYKFNNKDMNNGIGKISWVNMKSAVVYGLLTMAVIFVLAVAEAVVKHGSLFGVDWKSVVDAGGMATLSIFVTIVSVIKNLLTTNSGAFLGVTQVIDETK